MNDEPIIHDEVADLNQWLFQFASRFAKGKILEVGSGNGNISALFSLNGPALRISDPQEHHCDALQHKFLGDIMIKRIHRLDLENKNFSFEYERFLGKFDTIVSLNSSMFTFSNPAICSNSKRLLRARGRLIVLLPATLAPYDTSEDVLEDWYQWNWRSASKLLGKDGELITIRSFLLSDIPPPSSTGSELLPIFESSENTSSLPPGFYIILVARKLY